MAKNKEPDDEMIEITRPAAGAMTVSVALDFDEDEWGCPDGCSHTLKTSIPDPQGLKTQSGRLLSAGFVFGMHLARVANHFREAIANADEIADGFAREMQDWEKDYGRKRRGGE